MARERSFQGLLKELGEQLRSEEIELITEECKFLKPIDKFEEWNEQLRLEGSRGGSSLLFLLASQHFIARADVRLLERLLEPLNSASLSFRVKLYKDGGSVSVHEPRSFTQLHEPSSSAGLLREPDELEDLMEAVAGKLGRKWRDFAFRGLRLSTVTLEEIEHKGRMDGWSLRQLAFDAMEKWRSLMGGAATPNALKFALEKVDQRQIAEEVFQANS